MKRIVALIPARLGSKGIKNKNLKKIGNLNLVQRAINTAKDAKIFEKIILSSDSKKILKFAYKKNIFKHLRSKKYATNKSNISQTIIDVKKKYKLNNTYLFILEPTSPLRTIKQIKRAYSSILKKNLDSFCYFTEAMISPHRIWKIKNKKFLPIINDNKIWLPRQSFQKYYQAVGNVIVINLDKYKPKKGILFGKTGHILIDKIESIDIDTPDDLNIVRKIINKK